MGLFKEFKEFAVKGNVMDMAIGVVIGGAFGKIVTSLVSDITWGNFIQVIFDFLIIAFCIFLVVKGLNSLKKKEEPAPEAPKGPSQEELLTEIRDLLKNK